MAFRVIFNWIKPEPAALPGAPEERFSEERLRRLSPQRPPPDIRDPADE